MGKKYNPKNLLIKGQRSIEDEEKSKLQSEKTIAKRVQLRRQKACDEKVVILMNLLIFHH